MDVLYDRYGINATNMWYLINSIYSVTKIGDLILLPRKLIFDKRHQSPVKNMSAADSNKIIQKMAGQDLVNDNHTQFQFKLKTDGNNITIGQIDEKPKIVKTTT